MHDKRQLTKIILSFSTQILKEDLVFFTNSLIDLPFLPSNSTQMSPFLWDTYGDSYDYLVDDYYTSRFKRYLLVSKKPNNALIDICFIDGIGYNSKFQLFVLKRGTEVIKTFNIENYFDRDRYEIGYFYLAGVLV